ncbi:MAG: CoA-binding protein [Dehalococcoidia bacterium]|nr:CoA-binding protein [Dehalococcoidia bacterium]
MATSALDLDFLFYPQSVAIAGATNSTLFAPGKRYVQSLIKSGFKGKIYPLNSSGEDVLGLKSYRSIREVPGTVEHVISCIPAPATPQLVRDAIEKNAKVVTLFTSGFSEIDAEEGQVIERELLEVARRGGVRLLGPNCMGLICPESGLAFFTSHVARKGPLAFLAQSGGHAHELVAIGALRGLGFTKIISYGNGADLNESDFLRYLAGDPETRIIATYIEGVKNGPEFAQALSETAAAKPVIALKGGKSSAGARAASSHTGSLAGSARVWDILFRQAGVLAVNDIEEMADLCLAFSHLRPPQGRRVGIITFGGGRGVLATDECQRAGMVVPPFPPELCRKLGEFTPGVGTNVKNPVDSTAKVAYKIKEFRTTVELVAACEEIDLLLVYLYADFLYPDISNLLQDHTKVVVEAAHEFGKPVAMVLSTCGTLEVTDMVLQSQQIAAQGGIPTYPTVSRAARSLGRFIQHHEGREP